MLAVVVAFMLTDRVSTTPLQYNGGGGQNSIGMFPGKATWGPSPLAGGSLATGTGSPGRSTSTKGVPVVRPDAPKVVATSVAVDEVKVGFPPLPSPSQIPSRRPSLPPQIPSYTVGESARPAGRLVVLQAGISGDSPYVITRQRGLNSKRFFGSITKPLK